MTDVWSASTGGSSTGRHASMWDRIIGIPFVCCLSAGAVFFATLLAPSAPAGADQVSQLQSEAAQLSKEMLLEQLQIGGYEQQHAADLAQTAQDQQALASTQAQIAAVHRRIARDVEEVTADAVHAYVDDGTQMDGSNALFQSDGSYDARSVYAQVLTGDLNGAMAQLRADRHALQADESTQQQLLAAAEQLQSQAATLLADAQSTQQSLQAQSAQITGQLAVAVAQEQAEQAAAAAAAVAAAQAQAQAAAQQQSATQSVALAAAPATASASLPPFLTCVIQAESGGNYEAVSPTGTYMGAFQFSQSTWNEAAQLAGLPTLVGVPPTEASPADQDALAIALYAADGEAPWYDPCRTG